MCKMIGGDELLIYGVDSDLLFLTVVIYTTTGGGIFIYAEWSRYEVVFERLDLSLCIFIPVITWGNQLVIYVHG